MKLLDIMRSRKSVRNYADTPIPQGKLDKILETAIMTAQSPNIVRLKTKSGRERMWLLPIEVKTTRIDNL